MGIKLVQHIFGISGGSGSGKTYFAKHLVESLGPENCVMILQDNYYFDQSHKFDFDGGSVNFDHPSSLDFGLLAQHLSQLKRGENAEVPLYDFATHSRKKETIQVEAKPYLVVDGILVLHSDEVRPLFDTSVFVDTPEAVRYERRLLRDTLERGRTAEGVRNQFESQVKPMHDMFVEPSEVHAQYLISSEERYVNCLTQLSEKFGIGSEPTSES